MMPINSGCSDSLRSFYFFSSCGEFEGIAPSTLHSYANGKGIIYRAGVLGAVAPSRGAEALASYRVLPGSASKLFSFVCLLIAPSVLETREAAKSFLLYYALGCQCPPHIWLPANWLLAGSPLFFCPLENISPSFPENNLF